MTNQQAPPYKQARGFRAGPLGIGAQIDASERGSRFVRLLDTYLRESFW
jgi:hypothetical protein